MNSSNQPVVSCDEEYDNILNTAALGIIDLSKNTTFRTIVSNHALVQFDGDDNVLLKDLASNYSGGISGLATDMLQSLDNNKDNIANGSTNPLYEKLSYYNDLQTIERIIDGYELCGNTIYPQVYIPFSEQVNLEDQPVIVIGYDDFDDGIAPGYKINANGSIDIINIDELYAQTHLVWVISINERVDENGSSRADIITENEINAASERASSVLPKHVRISQFRVDQKNEKWISGKAEISWQALHTLECNENGVLSRQPMQKLKSNQIGTLITPSLGSSLMATGIPSANNPNPKECLTFGESLHFVFYELDSSKPKWGRTFKPLSTVFCPFGPSLNYFAKQGAYGEVANLHYTSFPGGTSFTVAHSLNLNGAFVQLSSRFAP